MKTESNPLKKLLLTGILALAALPVAHAVPTLRLTDGTNTLMIQDSSVGDLNNAVGEITYNGSLGGFNLNLSTGTSNGGILTLDTAYISGAAGKLEISFFDDISISSYSGIATSIYGKTAGSVSYSLNANSTSLLAPLTFGAGNISYTGFKEFPLPEENYSLMQKVVINHTGSGQVTNFYSRVVVPDGGSTAALLGLALVGVAGLRRKLLVNTA